MALGGGFAEPIQGFPGVRFYPDAVPEAQAQPVLGPGIAPPGGLVEPLGGPGVVLLRAEAPGVGNAQPPLGRRVAAVCQAAEAALGGGGVVLGRVKPFGHQLRQGRALLRLPLLAQGAGGLGGCHREGGGVAFVIAGPVVPAGGADGGCGVFLVTYGAFPHGGPP